MTVYVCYFDYGEWDSCTHPVVVFLMKEEAIKWCDLMQSSNAVYREMIIGREYLTR